MRLYKGRLITGISGLILFSISAAMLVSYGTTSYAGLNNKAVKKAKSYVIRGKRYYPLAAVHKGYTQTGEASWYDISSNYGTETASGRPFNHNELTVASVILPMYTKVKITNLKNNKTVIATVTDRGPYAHNRIMDLSKATAIKLGCLAEGKAHVKVTVL